MEAQEYDLIVIGAGMIGSSVAKYASCDLKRRACLIGPAELASNLKSSQPLMYSCWNDEGRLYRAVDEKPYWGILTHESVARYPEIAKQSGIHFYDNCGYLSISGPACAKYGNILKAFQRVTEDGLECHMLNSVTKNMYLPMLAIPEGATAIYEPKSGQAGYVSARKMVAAQQEIAIRHGCQVVCKVATKVTRDDKGVYSVSLHDGKVLRAEKICLCMGTYTKVLPIFRDIVPGLDLSLTAQTLAFIEISRKEAARLANLPPIVVQLHEWKYTYLIPPILYPDGKIYLKVGMHDTSRTLTTLADMEDHYANGPDARQVEDLVAQAKGLLPGLEVQSVHGEGCVTCNTPGKTAPFVDVVAPGMGVATGGCGYAAKCCDEIGRLAALLLLEGRWDSEVPRHATMARFSVAAKI